MRERLLEVAMNPGQQGWLKMLQADWMIEVGTRNSIATIALSNGERVEVIHSPFGGNNDEWVIHHVTQEETLLRLTRGPDLMLQLHNAKFELEGILSGDLFIRSHLRYLPHVEVTREA